MYGAVVQARLVTGPVVSPNVRLLAKPSEVGLKGVQNDAGSVPSGEERRILTWRFVRRCTLVGVFLQRLPNL